MRTAARVSFMMVLFFILASLASCVWAFATGPVSIDSPLSVLPGLAALGALVMAAVGLVCWVLTKL